MVPTTTLFCEDRGLEQSTERIRAITTGELRGCTDPRSEKGQCTAQDQLIKATL